MMNLISTFNGKNQGINFGNQNADDAGPVVVLLKATRVNILRKKKIIDTLVRFTKTGLDCIKRSVVRLLNVFR